MSKIQKSQKIALAILGISSSFLIMPAAFANETNTTNAVDKLGTEVAKVETSVDKVIPIAVATTIYGAGVMLVKRVIFA